MARFIAAAVQAAPVFMDRAATTRKACRLIREASEKGAKVIAFPESFIPAFPYGVWHHGVRRNMQFYKQLHESAVSLDGPEVTALKSAAREAGSVVVMGVTERDGGSLYNAQLFLGADGSLLGTRRKLKPTSAERLVWGEGDGAGLRVHDTGETGRIGGLICGEHNLSLARYTMQSQQEQLHIASYPDPFMEGRSFAERVDAAVRHYAAEGQCFVLNATGYLDQQARDALYDSPELADELDRDPTAFNGYSSIIAPNGTYLAGPVFGKEAILTAEIDLGRIPFSKFWFDPSGHSGRPDVFRMQVNWGGGEKGGDGWAAPSEPPTTTITTTPAPPQNTDEAAESDGGGSTTTQVGHGYVHGYARLLGLRLDSWIGKSLADADSDELKEVLDAVWHHGVVCISGQDLSGPELLRLSYRIGEPIILPKCFFKGMRDPSLPQVCRVGNLKPGAECEEDINDHPELLITGAKFAEYWHHDGNFYAQPHNAVLNALHAKCVPNVGGNTRFLDSTGALHDSSSGGVFCAEEIEALKHSTLTVSHEWISDFQVSSKQAELYSRRTTHHHSPHSSHPPFTSPPPVPTGRPHRGHHAPRNAAYPQYHPNTSNHREGLPLHPIKSGRTVRSAEWYTLDEECRFMGEVGGGGLCV